jgi:hypothetical protein
MKSFETHLETLNEIFEILQFIHRKLWSDSIFINRLSLLIQEFELLINDFEDNLDNNFSGNLQGLIRKLDEISEILTQIKIEHYNDLKVKELKYFIGIIEIEIYNLNK